MGTSQNWRARARLRGQAGFSTMGAMMALGATATVGSLVLMNSGEQVSAAEQTVCEYNKGIIETAIEADRVSDPSFTYPAAAGDDGLDNVRAAGWLRSNSKYWKYTGVGPNGQPQLVLRAPIAGCD